MGILEHTPVLEPKGKKSESKAGLYRAPLACVCVELGASHRYRAHEAYEPES
jgi:hypothetical protein